MNSNFSRDSPSLTFPATRWRLGPPLGPCFEAPSLSEADLVPAMTASCGLS